MIDLLVNDDTIAIAKLLPNINSIHTFSYKEKREKHWSQEKKKIQKIFRQYDLSINLTASDRSVIYSILAGKKSISAIEKKIQKSWWKKIFLTYYYYFDTDFSVITGKGRRQNSILNYWLKSLKSNNPSSK